MRFALVSDIHSNLEALKAVFADAREQGVDAFHSLGDAVGYGPEPQACVELLRETAEIHLMGNHDAAVVDRTSTAAFNDNARKAVEWTQTVMDESALAFLTELPYEARLEDLLLVHASPQEPPAWHYILSMAAARQSFDYFTERACFVGHTHVPFIVALKEDGTLDEVSRHEALFEEGSRYVINTGSVGQPRDRDPRASYAIVDTSPAKVEIRRVPYAIEKTQDLMRERGLPSFLIERLSVGR